MTCNMKGNPNPVRTPEFFSNQFKRYGEADGQLSRRVTSIRLPVDIDAVLWEIPKEKRIPWLRRVIVEAVERELMGQPPPAMSGNLTHGAPPAIPGNGATSPTDDSHSSATSGVNGSQPVEDAPKTLSTGETIHSRLGQSEALPVVSKKGRRKRGGGEAEGQSKLFGGIEDGGG